MGGGDAVLSVGADDVGEVFVQGSTANDVDDLYAATDRQGRHVTLDGGARQVELGPIALAIGHVDGAMRSSAVVRWVDVTAAGENQRIESVHEAADVGFAGGDQQRDAPGSPDRVDVPTWQRELAVVILSVGGDADEWW